MFVRIPFAKQVFPKLPDLKSGLIPKKIKIMIN